jgi:4-diphosphocytidyl-2-C-methyl-D-erythritol kinase
VLDWLDARFGNSRMTGSGSAGFARLCEERLEVGSVAPSAATCLAEMPPGWVGRVCSSLGQHPLRGWAG